MKKTKDNYSINGRVWIEKDGETYIGYGRVILLERIKKYGSISMAARSMDMSYRHAWELVESMNRLSKKRLVETSTGGRGGGGAIVTAEGEKVIELFWSLFSDLKIFLEEEEKRRLGVIKGIGNRRAGV